MLQRFRNPCNFSIHALLAESDISSSGVSAGRMLFYPRSPCGERLGRVNSMLTLIQFSIHALLAESDVEKVPADVFYSAFLSTLSLRRATCDDGRRKYDSRFFYPRSPCGERRLDGRFKL